MIEIVNKFEKVVYALLMILLMAVLIAAVVELGWLLITSLIRHPVAAGNA